MWNDSSARAVDEYHVLSLLQLDSSVMRKWAATGVCTQQTVFPLVTLYEYNISYQLNLLSTVDLSLHLKTTYKHKIWRSSTQAGTRRTRFLLKRDRKVTTLRSFAIANPSVVSVVCLSSVTFVRPTQPVEIFGNISSPFCTVAILWPPCKILRRSSQGR